MYYFLYISHIILILCKYTIFFNQEQTFRQYLY
uniref:Uncharacterized protein n=1 Tax=Myoviridae sp. ctPuP5 TaxID=2823543 RepID=A0A8S5LA57_9CAUD|nr:MAG TPA: hypothetical protein [Myoviridae sp. ctPuP5]